MDFRFTPAQDAFRAEVRDFLSTLPPTRSAEEEQYLGAHDKDFSKRVAERGWIGQAWPREFGGQEMGFIERAIYTEEMITACAPVSYHFISERQMGPTLMRHGTDEQKQLIRKIASADMAICIGMSEPEAGSDLANVATRAVIDGDDYILNGQKIWTSHAQHSDMIMVVCRTNPDVPKHKGISLLLVDLKSPGISIRPLINMIGVHGFNEIFFDDVRVPRKNLLGRENEGWYILAENLDFERGGIERLVTTAKLHQELIEFMKTAPELPGGRKDALRHEIAEREIEFQVGWLLSYRVAWQFAQGLVPNYEASMSKVYGTEWTQRLARTGMHVVGAYGLMATPEQRELRRKIEDAYVNTLSHTLAGGTSEVQRNIISTRGLGLPR
ncbi:MAG: acyl-CoA dehydrogenase family protein [Dehalococcoidia bacterium]|nr:acyl-CoA dehydrogenase family protein [Dehalococcoidia bacterium]